MGEPPLDAGADHVTATDPLPAVAMTPVGAPGTVRGVTAPEAADAGPVPALLAAVTVKVYAVPLESPETVQVVAVVGLGVQLAPPGVAVT